MSTEKSINEAEGNAVLPLVSGSVYFNNDSLKNIAKNAEAIYKSKTVKDVKFNDIWLDTIQKLCKQAKTDR